jgi:hypothetical protein
VAVLLFTAAVVAGRDQDASDMDVMLTPVDEYLLIKSRTMKPLAVRFLLNDGIERIEVAYSFDMKVDRMQRFRMSDLCAGRDRARAVREAELRYAGFMAGYRHNHGAYEAITKNASPIVAPPTGLPEGLCEADRAIWQKGWSEGCRSGYRYFDDIAIRRRLLRPDF